MNKLIIKTIFITLGTLLVVVGVFYMCFSLFAPQKMAQFWSELGNDKTAVKYMDRAYEKSDDLNDLVTLCSYAVKTGDNRLIDEHLSKLFNDNTFEKYCQSQKEGVNEEQFNFFASKYTAAGYKAGKERGALIDKAFEISKNYGKNNAVQSLIYESYSAANRDYETLEKVLEKLKIFEIEYSAEAELRKQKDINNLLTILSGR